MNTFEYAYDTLNADSHYISLRISRRARDGWRFHSAITLSGDDIGKVILVFEKIKLKEIEEP